MGTVEGKELLHNLLKYADQALTQIPTSKNKYLLESDPDLVAHVILSYPVLFHML